MIPLFFIALALSAAVAAYEFSPSTHAWVDDHVRAIKDTALAHRVVDAHLSAARVAAHPVTAVQHAQAALVANRAAAQATVAAAKTAKTESQRAAAAQSATLVLVRESEITDTLADAHLGAAGVVADPIDTVQHLHEADEANRATALKTAEAAKVAQTEKDRAAAAQSAAKILERERKIADALAKLGVGQCDVRSYAHVTPQIKDVLLAKLHGEGMTVTGDNPWDIDTHNHEVKLRAVWNPATQLLKLIVTSGADGLKGLVVCPAVWEKIDPILKEIVSP